MYKLATPMSRGLFISPSFHAVLQECVLPLSNSVMVSNDLPSEVHIEKKVCSVSSLLMSNILLA